MAEPKQQKKTLFECADNLERLYFILTDLGLAVAENYPGISLVIGDCATAIKQEEEFLHEF